MRPQPSTAMHNAGATNRFGDKENYQARSKRLNTSPVLSESFSRSKNDKATMISSHSQRWRNQQIWQQKYEGSPVYGHRHWERYGFGLAAKEGQQGDHAIAQACSSARRGRSRSNRWAAHEGRVDSCRHQQATYTTDPAAANVWFALQSDSIRGLHTRLR